MCLIEQFVLSGDGEIEAMDDNNTTTTNDNAQQQSSSIYTASVQHASVGSEITKVVSADEQVSVCFVHATTTLAAV
jgi:hypothetical protein